MYNFVHYDCWTIFDLDRSILGPRPLLIPLFQSAYYLWSLSVEMDRLWPSFTGRGSWISKAIFEQEYRMDERISLPLMTYPSVVMFRNQRRPTWNTLDLFPELHGNLLPSWNAAFKRKQRAGGNVAQSSKSSEYISPKSKQDHTGILMPISVSIHCGFNRLLVLEVVFKMNGTFFSEIPCRWLAPSRNSVHKFSNL